MATKKAVKAIPTMNLELLDKVRACYPAKDWFIRRFGKKKSIVTGLVLASAERAGFSSWVQWWIHSGGQTNVELVPAFRKACALDLIAYVQKRKMSQERKKNLLAYLHPLTKGEKPSAKVKKPVEDVRFQHTVEGEVCSMVLRRMNMSFASYGGGTDGKRSYMSSIYHAMHYVADLKTTNVLGVLFPKQ